MRHCTRRTALRTGCLALLGSLAGCSALPTGTSGAEDLTFERLDVTAVYVAEGVELSVPAEVQTVSAAHNADLLVLPGDTGADADQVVEWFADDRTVALLGDRSEATWLSWARSDAFEDAFANEGFADSEPDPSLIVGARIGQYVRTYRHSWADGPRDRDVLRALDESLVDVEEETPPG
jgi:hypothetical protein